MLDEREKAELQKLVEEVKKHLSYEDLVWERFNLMGAGRFFCPNCYEITKFENAVYDLYGARLLQICPWCESNDLERYSPRVHEKLRRAAKNQLTSK